MVIVVQIWPNKAIQLERIDRGKSAQDSMSPLVLRWKMGEPNPFRENKGDGDSEKDDPPPFAFLLNSSQVLAMAAGPELELIRTHMSNIPWVIKSSTKTVQWMGDHAKFIALNFDF